MNESVLQRFWSGIVAILLLLSACGKTDQQSIESQPSVKQPSVDTPAEVTLPSPEVSTNIEEVLPDSIETVEDRAKAAMENLEVWDGSIAESFDGGDGSNENPYKIANGAQLAKLSDDAFHGVDFSKAYFILTSDIMLNDINGWDFENIDNNLFLHYDGWNNWCPIGPYSGGAETGCQFRGTVDGCGHTVYGMYSNLGVGVGSPHLSQYATGLFGCVYQGSISNLNLCCSIISPYNSGNIGGIAGDLEYGATTNCQVHQIVIDATSNHSTNDTLCVGGICGRTVSTQISNCFSDARIYYGESKDADGNLYGNDHLYIGGIVGDSGYDESIINDCLSRSSIVATPTINSDSTPSFLEYNPSSIFVGGVCGRGYSIVNSYSFSDLDVKAKNILQDDAKIYAIAAAGGIAGQCKNFVSNCGTQGKLDLSGDFDSIYQGGIAGILGNASTPYDLSSFYDVETSLCYSNIEMVSENAGGISGYACGNITVKNCYYNKDFSSRAVPNADARGSLFTDQIKALSEEELRSPENYYNWDFDWTWIIDDDENQGLPMLRTMMEEQK